MTPADAALATVREWVALPSFSATGEGIGACADYTRDLVATVAPDAAIVPTGGHPAVVGTVTARDPDAPTLTVYALYDVTPTLAPEWRTDPLVATVVPPAHLGLDDALGPLLVGRGVNNHKGPVAAVIHAVRRMLDERGDVPVHLVFLIEGEEEIGSPHLPEVVARHRDLLARSSGVWLPTCQQNRAGAMALRRAYKGAAWVELRCTGGEWGGPRDGRHRWAGHAAWLDAPLMRLVRALASLYDDRQRVAVAGLPTLPPDADTAALVQRFREPATEAALRRQLDVARFLGGEPVAAHVPHYTGATTINVQGVTGGYQGPGSYTMMPGAAAARLDLRFPPGVTPDAVAGCLRAHLDAHGHGMVEVVVTGGYPGAAALPPEQDTLLAAARTAAAAHGVPVDVWPIANNCCPASLLSALGQPVPFSVAGLGHGDRPHAPDEYLTLDSIAAMLRFTPTYLDAWAAEIRAGCRRTPGTPPRALRSR